jgi:hypothetical protein
MLFPVYWLGLPHIGGECLKYVDVQEGTTFIDQITEIFQTEIIASSDGLVIRKKAVEYMLTLFAADGMGN